MAATTTEQEITELVRRLPPDLQRRVRDFAAALVVTEPRMSGSVEGLLDWLHAWDPADAEDVARALEEARD